MLNQFYIDYIKAIENPDRVGWNGKVWTAPQYKGYDKNQRGYGIDIVKNDSARRLTQNRPGQWLTEKEADKLMKEHLLYVYGAALKHIEGFDNLSDRRKAALLGMLYRGDSVNKNRHIININEPDDNKFFESINNYYKSKGLNERARNSSNFFNNNQQTTKTNFLIPMKWEQWKPPMKFKSGGLIRKMLTAAGGPIHYSRTMTADNLSKAANYVGEYILKGLGTFGKIMTAPLTGGPLGTATVVLPKTKKLLDAERKIRETQELLIGKASTWLSPLNYGTALITGHGLNAKKGEEKVASWSPAWQAAARLGELYVGPKGVKAAKATPKAVVNTAAKAGSKMAKRTVVAREIKLGIKLNSKNGKIEVTEDYFNSPDKWYRVSERPEKIGIELNGKNVTTSDDPGINGTINGWRESMLSLTGRIIPGKGINEGYFIFLPRKISLSKHGAAHGNTSQAAKGLIWLGTFAFSDKFPIGVIEGLAPVKIFRGMNNLGKDSRTNFVLLNWKDVPLGARVGFHTGEMPMSNLGWFQRTNKGTYTYEPIIPEKRITHHPILLLEPLTSLKFFERKPSRITEAERMGVPKRDRNFTSQWHVANYPGYLLKGLMRGSLLEKQISKNGTININLLNAYFNKASQVEREVANKVLTERFSGLKAIDYNLFKKAVLDELITYTTKPQTKYADYGIDRLGINSSYNIYTDLRNSYPGRFAYKTDNQGHRLFYDRNTGKAYSPASLHTLLEELSFKPHLTKLNTFTFESPRILQGSDKHYDYGTLGHSRTYTTPEEPKILHIMESLSDWALAKNSPVAVKTFNNLLKKIADLEAKPKKTISDKIDLEDLKRLKKDLLNLNSGLIVDPQQIHLKNNYLQRQLQENLRYAAENGLTKMRYPTSETVAKIEGYLKNVLARTLEEETEMLNLFKEEMMLRSENPNSPRLKEISDRMNEIANNAKRTYSPEHQTILKKYADFPKLFLKLFKDLKVGTITDTKGNTWYEVDVPKGYLSREWLFKQGGKMNILEFLKNGNKIKKALWGTNLDVDNRSDTTRQGSGTMPDSAYGAADASNTGGLLSLLDTFNTVKDTGPRNVILSNGKQITIPGVLTGTPTFLPTFGPGLLLQGRLVNYVMNPAEKAARADFLKSADEIKTLAGSGHIPKGVQGDWMYPTEILKKYKLKQFSTPVKQEASNLLKITKLSETSSAKKTSSLRSKEYYSKKKEDRNNGISKVRSRLVLNNKAQTTGDMRAANTGRPRRAARYTDLRTELEKDTGFWGKQYNIIRRKVALGKQGAESKEKEFLESYWNYKQKGILNKEKFGGILFKKGGIIKASTPQWTMKNLY